MIAVMNTASSNFVDIAAFNKAAGDPLRLAILRVLAQDAYGVSELSDIFQHKQSGMSHHLKVLSEAGLVTKRREGNSIFYSRALLGSRQKLAVLQQQLYSTVDMVVISDEVRVRLQRVQQERVEASQQFFVQQAEKFKAQQDLIAEYPVYGDAVKDLLHSSGVVVNDLAVEIGPGTGEFLPVLANQFQRVIALDNAPTMLEKAQQYCEQQGVKNIHFVGDDTHYLASQEMSANCVVMNMVLHHTPSPADIFLDVAQCLLTDGVFILADLCRHDQDWAKTACGDVWLGFDPDELTRWAQSAGLVRQRSNYLALRNGFQIQLQQFIKV
ncbi:MAG: ArsR family transcriptional regulator [Candidatus Endobugula sp.]|jgi:DNA-binding transcriptional ArsR family regulator/ubiquinone/menaquinone biosynthesis C-methylase UbiE